MTHTTDNNWQAMSETERRKKKKEGKSMFWYEQRDIYSGFSVAERILEDPYSSTVGKSVKNMFYLKRFFVPVRSRSSVAQMSWPGDVSHNNCAIAVNMLRVNYADVTWRSLCVNKRRGEKNTFRSIIHICTYSKRRFLSIKDYRQQKSSPAWFTADEGQTMNRDRCLNWLFVMIIIAVIAYKVSN